MRIQSWYQRVGRFVIAAIVVGSTQAWAKPEPQPLALLAAASYGTPVTSIPSVSQIESWAALDDYHVVLQVAAHGTYRLTFSESCHNLRWAQSVSISGSQNRAWAGFDYLTADGKQCSIGAIERL